MHDPLTRISIWLAMLGYAAAVFLFSRRRLRAFRITWSSAAIAYVVHVLFAFGLHHDWNHAAAVEATAAQTLSQTGIATRVGIYVNHLFTLIWLIDAAYSWLVGPKRYLNRPAWIFWSMHLFFLFMIFNGGVVFATGPARWIAIAVIVTSVYSLYHTHQHSFDSTN